MNLFSAFTDATFETPIKFNVPTASGIKQFSCTGVFNHMPQSEIDAILDSEDGDGSIYDRVLAGWSGLTGKDGSSIPFNAENKEDMYQIPAFRSGVIKAYFRAVTGNGSASRRKN